MLTSFTSSFPPASRPRASSYAETVRRLSALATSTRRAGGNADPKSIATPA
jgi:hypothetical protein